MKAQSKDYIQLQNIYKAKARQDIDEVTQHVQSIEQAQKRKLPADNREIEAFCKGAAFVKLIKGQPLLTSVDNCDPLRLRSIFQESKDQDSLFPIFLAFLAYDATVAEKKSEAKSPREDDHNLLKTLTHQTQKIIAKIIASSVAPANEEDMDSHQSLLARRVEPILQELVRAGDGVGAELHNISALTGGMVAQEVIKVLTKQYVPVDNTCVFDGVGSKSGVFRV